MTYISDTQGKISKYNAVLKAGFGSCPAECTLCEEGCIRVNEDGKPRIHSISLPELNFHGVVTCNQCRDPECASVCPVHAIKRADSVVYIDNERCVGCGLCTLACPYGGIYYDPIKEKVFKCEMCQEKALPNILILPVQKE